jgi:hypothetical protein
MACVGKTAQPASARPIARRERQPEPARAGPKPPHGVEQVDARRGRGVVHHGAAHVVGGDARCVPRNLDRARGRSIDRIEGEERDSALTLEIDRQVGVEHAIGRERARSRAAKHDRLAVGQRLPRCRLEHAARGPDPKLRAHQLPARRLAGKEELELLVVEQRAALDDAEREPVDARPLAALASLERDGGGGAAGRFRHERLAQRRAGARHRQRQRQHSAEQAQPRGAREPFPDFATATHAFGEYKLRCRRPAETGPV